MRNKLNIIENIKSETVVDAETILEELEINNKLTESITMMKSKIKQ